MPCLVNLASMRDLLYTLHKDPKRVNPLVQTDLVVDHSIVAEFSGTSDSLELNTNLEIKQNYERYQFLKWGQKQFKNFTIIPPSTGILHPVNLEYLATVVSQKKDVIFPETIVGADSHTTMINAMGLLGWGVGGIEAESCMLGHSLSMLLPEVVGVRLRGKLKNTVNATDLVLHLVNLLREYGVVNKFVEFFGDGVSSLTLSDRSTIANMAPEYGATIGFFPFDNETIKYLRMTGRAENQIKLITTYMKANSLFYDPAKEAMYSGDLLDVDLNAVEPNVAGPKRPHDKVALKDMKKDFHSCLINKVSFKGYGLSREETDKKITFKYLNNNYTIGHGSIVISAICSSSNSSNPEVMLAAGILARNATLKGLKVAPYIKTTLSPGTAVVSKYLESTGLQYYLDSLGFHTTGFGCMTCIGSSGKLIPEVVEVFKKNKLIATAVLSGNRNFEGRVNPHTQANYLVSPPLCVAYALAGRVDIDWENEPIGKGLEGENVYLRDIWPTREEIQELIREHVKPAIFKETYSAVTKGTASWRSIKATDSVLFDWEATSTYIKQAPFMDPLTNSTTKHGSIKKARCLMYLGDSITTDHISPGGSIALNSPAAKYLDDKGVSSVDYNQYGTRRGNFEIVARCTFSNHRILNKLVEEAGTTTVHFPTGLKASVFEVAEMYKKDKTPLIVLAGKEYGCGSSRDSAAKGPKLLGIKAIIAESFERIHRSNLVMVGILPCEFMEGQNGKTLGLTGQEVFDMNFDRTISVNEVINVETDCGKKFQVRVRIDTEQEVEYYKSDGLLNHILVELTKE